jgi:hypothetical protein
MALLTVFCGLGGYLVPAIRDVKTSLSDHDVVAVTEAAES